MVFPTYYTGVLHYYSIGNYYTSRYINLQNTTFQIIAQWYSGPLIKDESM